jgi:3-carboxy-cis,cis-muconate cycloisomerase
MRANFDCSKHFIMSESLTMKLAAKIGRESAYNLVKNLLKHATGEYSFMEIVQASPKSARHYLGRKLLPPASAVIYRG